ncbi:hypothetical protein NE857_28175 [Nocardiopsis exhalans]|uniref:Uncharacterized protein n=1 Tax=Nocardiopsis exhalans TaxID=163604 RepID=A0ABY5D7N3_9ACTN|nr:hypothetical protein [Nocardiopsis exhalans]USY19106.1 hypothetical protein NE857_28175 [Nocardiopsis exhalans]
MPPKARSSTQDAVYGQLLQIRDIHGGVTLNAPPQAPFRPRSGSSPGYGRSGHTRRVRTTP